MNTPLDRPRLIFICQYNPWRLNAGGIIRNYWLVQALARRFEVDLVTADDVDNAVPAAFAALCSGIHFFPRPVGFQAKFARALGSFRPLSSYYTSGSVTREMRTGVARLLAASEYGAIVTELGLVDAVPNGCSVPLVYSSHNCESALLARRAKFEPIWSRLAMAGDALRVRRVESRLIDRSIFATPCSQNDLDDMTAFAPAVVHKSVVIPNGVDCASYAHIAHAAGTAGVVLITGSFDWLPNRRGLLWFVKEVLPILDQAMKGQPFSVRVAGRMTSDFVRKLNTIRHVTAVPNVPRMEAELRGASVVAVPIIASSGTRLRILEAWAAGRPIVTTSHGAFGLDYTDGVDILAESSPETPRRFAEAAALLLRDDRLRGQLRVAGLERAATYDWSVIGAKLLETFERFGVLRAAVPVPEATTAAHSSSRRLSECVRPRARGGHTPTAS